MDRDMRLRKVCPQCNMVVHVKRSCCGCGHVFTLKRKVQVSADKSMGKAVKRRRALEAWKTHYGDKRKIEMRRYMYITSAREHELSGRVRAHAYNNNYYYGWAECMGCKVSFY